MITLSGLTKSYARGAVKAVNNLSLSVERGEIFGFIGPNGAGKTTTIKMITGVLQPDEGRIAVGGVDMLTEPVRAKKLIGYVPDNHDIFDRLKGIEYLNFIGDVYGVPLKERRERIEKYLTMFGIADAAGELIRSYSHGMKQKLMLTGALIHKPPLWLLDEPLTGLDPKSALSLKEEMRAHCREGNTVFFSTHVLEVAERLCDRIGIIDRGRLAAVGTMDSLRSGEKDATLEKLFFELTEKPEASL
ncbi:MAG: ABC transporter ATP-binding protein [Oscillospiraceae bacterium]|jgi:ABC-2 type transport system ATP-binding protein|nr:ABC transporter ATP-binding protein [Oscillospiraceae bacterium]